MTSDQWDQVAVRPSGTAFPPASTVPAQRKDPMLSLIASFFIPGLGTILNGRTGRGLGILGLWVLVLIPLIALVSFALFVATYAIFLLVPVLAGVLGIWIWGMVDAYQVAEQHNRLHGLG